MIYEGIVQNGVVVFGGGLHPPEGSVVRVELTNQRSTQPASPPGLADCSPNDEALLRMSELATDLGIPDLAANIDHYLYGHPKVTDGK